ncbi:unnamed protein product [Heligmosomoides polygyrus]|uniref:Protein GOLM2 n=1 Tax=Heligmosomoides polygyrus TaxID=6339 RepID=A0A183GL69_HELPZ|nr:unnamed protein product [Heligmosomoides polygyrus]
MEVARTQDHTNDKNKKLKKPSPDVPGKEVPRELCEYEKKAADEGFILPPQNVKHMGNIDDIAQERKEQIQKEVETIKSDRDKTTVVQNPANLKIHINEKNCVLYETNDAATLDDQEDGDDPLADLY